MFSLQIRDVLQIKASIPSSSMPCPHLCSGDPSSIPKAEKKSFCSGTRGRSDVLVARLLALTAGIIFRDYLSVAVINRADVENNYTNRHISLQRAKFFAPTPTPTLLSPLVVYLTQVIILRTVYQHFGFESDRDWHLCLTDHRQNLPTFVSSGRRGELALFPIVLNRIEFRRTLDLEKYQT